MDPFKVLLPECWETVLDKLEPAGKNAVLISHSQFDKEFKRKKIFWLLELVLPLLLKQTKDKKDLLLGLRLVCKKWCKIIDEFIISNNTDLSTFQFQWKYIRPRPAMEFSPLLNAIKLYPSNRNPILSRNLTIRFLDEPNPNLRNEETEKSVLSEIGKYIWFMQFHIVGFGDFSGERFSEHLQKCLQLTPNVRGLTFFEALRGFDNPEEYAVVEAMLLPELAMLSAVALGNYGCLPDQLTDEILKKYQNQLRNLQMDIRHWKEEYNFGFFPMLETLVITGTNDHALEKNVAKLESIFVHLEAPHLRELTVEIKYPFGVNSIEFHKIMGREKELGNLLQNKLLSLLKTRCPNVTFQFKTWFNKCCLPI